MTETSENLPDVLEYAVAAIQNRQRNHYNIESDVSPAHNTNQDKWRNLMSFWILGLCNNYGYVVMLTAAHDIIERFNGYSINTVGGSVTLTASRDCALMSSGVLLLADTIPSMFVKVIAPFLPFFINIRMTVVCLLSAVGLAIVAAAQTEWLAIFGIILTSFSCGLGETSLLAYTPKFDKNVISTWSSGTGASGVGGSLTYSGLIMLNFTPKQTLLLMLIVPLLQAVTFFIILKEPNSDHIEISPSTTSTESLIDYTNINDEVSFSQTPLDLKQKIQYSSKLLKYVIPLFTVYISEYFINQGLYELIFFPHIWLDHSTQYRWLQVDYQIGVFISRSSVNFFQTKHIWFLSILQFFNVIYFTYDAVYLSAPTIWFIFVLVFWEGLLGGCCYVNTFNRITKELPTRYKSFGMAFAGIGESLGVVGAGLLAIPIHNVICKMPLHETYY